MNSHKERFIQNYDRLLTENPSANPDDLADQAYQQLTDDMAAMIDDARDRAKEGK